MNTDATAGCGCSLAYRGRTSSPAQQPEGMMDVPEGDSGSGPAEEWSLLSHSPGQEPTVVGLEELYRLQRAAGNADGPAEELLLVER